MCGAGAQHAAAEVAALAEALQAPVTAFRSGRGVVPEDHPLGVASVAARELWDDVDVLVGVGSRLEMPYMRWGNSMRYERKPSQGPKLIRIDIDPAEMRRFEPDVGVIADSATACRLLAERLRTRVAPNRERTEEIAAAKRTAEAAFERIRAANVIPSRHPRRLASRRHPRPRAIASRVCDLHGRVTRSWRRAPISRKVSRAHSASVFQRRSGAKVANPDKAVVSVTGDGGFMFGVQELATAAQYGIASLPSSSTTSRLPTWCAIKK